MRPQPDALVVEGPSSDRTERTGPADASAETAPDARAIEAFVRLFVEEYVAANRSVMIANAFDVAYGGCGPFAEELVAALGEAFPGVRAHDRDTQDMLDGDPCLPRPDGYDYDIHVYVEVETSGGTLFYDAVTPQGVPYPSMLSFNAQQVRFARAFGDHGAED
jgi:hypothetical protein